MNESNRNTRTLIVSFVVAIMALIPLRFIEVGQLSIGNSGYEVLGDTSEEVVLPNAEVYSEGEVLEAPYNEIENQAVLGEATESNCFPAADADKVLGELSNVIETTDLTRSEIDEVVAQMVEVENNTCK